MQTLSRMSTADKPEPIPVPVRQSSSTCFNMKKKRKPLLSSTPHQTRRDGVGSEKDRRKEEGVLIEMCVSTAPPSFRRCFLC